jgi:hypothetical protein
MKPRLLFVCVMAALAMTAPASAAIFTGSSTPGATVTDYSTASLVSFDLDMTDFSTTRLAFMLEEGDLLSPLLSLNAIVRNLSGAGLQRFTLSVDGMAFSGQGSVTPTFGTLGATTYGSHAATVDFLTPEWAEFHFGNPLALADKSNWMLDVSGMRAGDTFGITSSVPEPSTLALMLACTALLSFTARRKG